MLEVVQLLKSWEYKNQLEGLPFYRIVVQLLKSWEYKNFSFLLNNSIDVVQLLKSWEYKNERHNVKVVEVLYSYLNLESTKTLKSWGNY